MKIISWNVNGIRAGVKKGFYDRYDQMDADIFCIQETKAQDDQVAEALAELKDGFLYSTSAEKKGYSGTAIISKKKPIAVNYGIGDEEHDNEGRVCHAEFEDFHLVNVYVPNSGSGMKRLDYRATWDTAFSKFLKNLMADKTLIVTGDFNVAHTEIDLARPKQNYNKTSGYTQKEIDGFDGILANGLIDTYRTLNPETLEYSFWNQRFGARERNVGWRIDYFLLSETAREKITKAYILGEVMGSDHCPIGLELKF